MSAWELRYDALHPTASALVRALVVLDLPEVVPEDLAVVLARRVADTTAALESLRRDGWIRTDPSSGTDVLADDARSWLTEWVMATGGEVTELAGRLVAHYAAQLDLTRHDGEQVASWMGDHRDGILTALRVGSGAGLHDAAAELAVATWQVAERVQNPEWWRELARLGEHAAKQLPDQATLFALLNLSAAVFAGADDKPVAQRQWIRALRLSQRGGDREGTVRMLTVLGEQYRRWDWLDHAMDTYLTLIDEHQKTGDSVAMASTLTELGETMLAAGEPADATAYFVRAEDLLAGEPAEAVRRVRARVLEQLGLAQWQSGQTRLARRSLARALDLTDGVDVEARDRLRAALDGAPDATPT